MTAGSRTISAAVVLVAAIAAFTLTAVVPATARADSTEASILMDDTRLLYDSPTTMVQTMNQIAALGVNVVKVSMVWSLVAPDPNGKSEPNFNASDPAAYPQGNWDRYDAIVELAHQLGMTVYFQLTGPAPFWATSETPEPESQGYSWSHEPSPALFKQFVEAVGTRYSGSYVPPSTDSDSSTILSALDPAKGEALPAVNWWGIWNEPNEIGWLSPQRRSYDGKEVAYAPALERGLTNAGYLGLLATGHADDTILIGEIASGGYITPLPFVRDFYCVGTNLQPLTGTAAAALDCPTSGDTEAFVNDNPGLFAATGWAQHPYEFDHAPNTPKPSQANNITLANLGRLERTIDGVFSNYGEPTGLPMYLTEWGYKSDPPNPFVHTSLAQQATWINEGEYMSYRDPRVMALAQYELYDQEPRESEPVGTLAYWSTFQTGLFFVDGDAKPSLAAYRLPIWVPSAHPGANVTVWGQLRPAVHTEVQYGVLEYEPTGSDTWSWLRILTTTNSQGYFEVQVPIAQTGSLRLAWQNPSTSTTYYSRTVSITG